MASQLFVLPYRPIYDETANVVPGAKLWFTLHGTNTPATVYADSNLTTPLSNPVVADGVGRLPTIYLNSATAYRMRTYLADGVVGVDTPLNEYDPYDPSTILGMPSVAQYAATRSDLALQDTSRPSYLTEAGREGIWVFRSGDYSAAVTADTNQGVYVAPNASTGLTANGSQGAWVRMYEGPLKPEYYGADELPQAVSWIGPITAKQIARNRKVARTMAADLTGMVGYAALAGTTGGAGQPEYWVTNASDDANFTGSFRWAVTQALAGGGGKILFDPRGSFDITLRSLLLIGASSLNVCNITVDAPGRNVTIRNMPKTEGVRLSGQNIIYRRIRHVNLNQSYIDGEEKDGLSYNPLYADKFWVDETERGNISDGVGDAASSALSNAAVSTASGFCRFTETHNVIRNQDKVIVLGKTGIVSGTLGDTFRVLATYFENWFHSVGQRTPLVQQNAFAHFVNNIVDFAPQVMQDGTTSGVSGAHARFGGAIDAYGNLWRSLDGSGYQGVYGDADGSYRSTGDATENSITVANGNTSYIPTPGYTLSPAAVPSAGAARNAWVESIISKCGPDITPFPRERYNFVAGAVPSNPDGVTIIPWTGGYYQAVEQRDRQLTADPNATVSITRQATKTIAAGVITINAGEGYFAVEGEGSVSDDLTDINGGADGMWFGLRCANAAHVITVKTTGNIDVPADVVLDDVGKTLWLIWDTGSTKWAVIASPPQSGTYTPTLTAVANCSALAVAGARYLRNGNVVTVSGQISGTNTAAALTKVGISLPIPSNVLLAADVSGVCTANTGAPIPGVVIGDAAADYAEARFTATGAGAFSGLNFIFQYLVN